MIYRKSLFCLKKTQVFEDPGGAEGPPRGLLRVSRSAPRDPWEHQREHLITKRTPKVVSWDQHVPFGELECVPEDQNVTFERPKMGLESRRASRSLNFFEKVTLLNLCIVIFVVEGPALLLISEV